MKRQMRNLACHESVALDYISSASRVATGSLVMRSTTGEISRTPVRRLVFRVCVRYAAGPLALPPQRDQGRRHT